MLRTEFWIISTLISVGVIGGFLYNRPDAVVHYSDNSSGRQFDPNASGQDEYSGFQDPAGEFAPQDEKALNRLVRQADELLQAGNFQDSLGHYQSAYRYRKHDPTLAFRIGLACELGQRPAPAEFFYGRCMVADTTAGNLRLAAVLGLARSQVMRGQDQQAFETLCENYLSRMDDERLDSGLRIQLGYQLAELLRQKSTGPSVFDSSILDQPLFANCEVDVAEVLTALDENNNAADVASLANETNKEVDALDDAKSEDASATKSSVVTVEEPLAIIQRPGDDVTLMVLRGFTMTVSIAQLIEQIETQTQLQIPLSVNVQPYLVGRTAKVRSTAIPVAIVLDCLLHPLGLAWFQVDQTIKVVPDNALETDQLRHHRLQQAIRMARQMVVNYPDGRCRDLMRLATANLYALERDVDTAATMLRQLAEEQPGGELGALVRLNMGLLERNLNRYDSASKLLLGAVDQASSNRTKAVAYANIARTNISQDALEPAIVAASRSLSLTEDLDIRRPAALDLARAYLLAGNPLSANQALFDHAETFQSGIEQSLAMVYGAYARSLATLSPIARNKAIESLVIALADLDANRLPTVADRILVSRAFMHIGLLDSAIESLEISAGEFENANWQRRRLYELASMRRQNRDFSQALEILSQLAGDPTDTIGQQSLLQMARIELEQLGNHQKCLELCRSLWRIEMIDRNKVEALYLMGLAYQAAGNNNLAAYCFLGLLPESDRVPTTSTSESSPPPQGPSQ